jgi:hypothetical protein
VHACVLHQRNNKSEANHGMALTIHVKFQMQNKESSKTQRRNRIGINQINIFK